MLVCLHYVTGYLASTPPQPPEDNAAQALQGVRIKDLGGNRFVSTEGAPLWLLQGAFRR